MFGLFATAWGAEVTDLALPFEKFILDNGLEVILHEDHSDPIVALATIVHVGSNREEPGRTGFAHFFEHMAFNDSENVPRGANRKRIEELGGTRNGGTSNDYTIYYEVVPADSLEKLLWIDSDRLGYMINTVTIPALENEKQVVKNEKRQRVDNAPYGHREEVVAGALYPPDHPYSWSVIGSLTDLEAATLEDVRAFHARWYGPNNATLVIAGDFEIGPTRALIEDYFGEIPRGPDVADPTPRPVTLPATVSLMHEDTFGKVPELQRVFPAVESGHPDEQALDALGQLLSRGKRAPLYRALVATGLATEVGAWSEPGELAGSFTVAVQANPGVDLDVVATALDEALAAFAKDGPDPRDLQQIKARAEVSHLQGLSTVLGKARRLGHANEFHGDPGYVLEELTRVRAVTEADVARVFGAWVADRPHVQTSFVPAGQPELAVAGAAVARVVVEPVVKGAEAPPAEVVEEDVPRTPTVFDRSKEPPLGPSRPAALPAVWSARTRKGVPVRGIVQDELPLVRFSVRFDGGTRAMPVDQAGLLVLLANVLGEGTALRTPEELEDAIGVLGAELSWSASRDSLVLTGSCLRSTCDELLALAAEVVREPRWDAAEFQRLKTEQLSDIAAREGQASAVAALVTQRLAYGDAHPYGAPVSGTAATVAGLELTDLQAWYARHAVRRVASFQIVGDIGQEEAVLAASFLDRLKGRKVHEPLWWDAPVADPSRLYFVDMPGAKQSVIVAMGRGMPGYRHELAVLNDRLGGGSSGRLFQVLRIDKGYTYGARSGFSVAAMTGTFQASTSVRANVTLESLQTVRDVISSYGDTFDEAAMNTTRVAMSKGEALEFETLGARLAHLGQLETLGLPDEELAMRQAVLASMTVDEVKRLAREWLNVGALTWVVVGDGATQRQELEAFGLPVVELTVNGDPVR